jgi:hypothetical protein
MLLRNSILFFNLYYLIEVLEALFIINFNFYFILF